MVVRLNRSGDPTRRSEAVMAEKDGAPTAERGAGRLAKPQRQHRIARLLEQHAVTSQGSSSSCSRPTA